MKRYRITNGQVSITAEIIGPLNEEEFYKANGIILTEAQWQSLGFTIEEVLPLEPRVFDNRVYEDHVGMSLDVQDYITKHWDRALKVTVEEAL